MQFDYSELCGGAFLILEAITLVIILVSTFTKKIGRQFSRRERSPPIFSISTITACFYEVDNTPLSEHSFAHQIKESLIRCQKSTVFLSLLGVLLF